MRQSSDFNEILEFSRFGVTCLPKTVICIILISISSFKVSNEEKAMARNFSCLRSVMVALRRYVHGFISKTCR